MDGARRPTEDAEIATKPRARSTLASIKRGTSPAGCTDEGGSKKRRELGPSAETGLVDLPADLIEMIMAIADVRGVVRFLQSCRWARSLLAGNQTFWRKRVRRDFGFPGVRFEPETSLTCPGWIEVYVAHHNLFKGHYTVLLPSPSVDARDPDYHPGETDDSSESAYDSDDPDHVIDIDEIERLTSDSALAVNDGGGPVPELVGLSLDDIDDLLESQLKALVSPDQWEAYDDARAVRYECLEPEEQAASIRGFPKLIVEGGVTHVGGGPRLWNQKKQNLGYNDSYELFLGRCGLDRRWISVGMDQRDRLWVARVEDGGGLGELTWQSTAGDNLKPLDFRGDVLALAVGDKTEANSPHSSQLKFVWGLGAVQSGRKHDVDVEADAIEAAVLPTGANVTSIAAWFVRLDGDLIMATVMLDYSFELDGEFTYDDKDGTAYGFSSCNTVESRRGRYAKFKRKATVVLVYKIDRDACAVTFMRGFDITKGLHQCAMEWELEPHLLADDMGLDDPAGEHAADAVKLGKKHQKLRHVYQHTGWYIFDMAIHGRIALICCRGCRDTGHFPDQGRLVCLDLVDGSFRWTATFAQRLDRVGPILADGSAVLLLKEEALIAVTFRKTVEGESWGPARCWPDDYMDAEGADEMAPGDYGDAETEGNAQAEGGAMTASRADAEGGDNDQSDPAEWVASTRSLVLESRLVWKQERVDGKLENHILYLSEPVGFRPI
ncbi:hypothetical protein HK101_004856 [Irineochytrium annulatum]|nr:hypothetical protein HK101_004856 [Irineochytrium annulatum]